MLTRKGKLQTSVMSFPATVPKSFNVYNTNSHDGMEHYLNYYEIIDMFQNERFLSDDPYIEEYKNILNQGHFPGTNNVYADREGNIFYISHGQFPYRNPKYDWLKVLPGNTSETLWEPKYHPVSELVNMKIRNAAICSTPTERLFLLHVRRRTQIQNPLTQHLDTRISPKSITGPSGLMN